MESSHDVRTGNVRQSDRTNTDDCAIGSSSSSSLSRRNPRMNDVRTTDMTHERDERAHNTRNSSEGSSNRYLRILISLFTKDDASLFEIIIRVISFTLGFVMMPAATVYAPCYGFDEMLYGEKYGCRIFTASGAWTALLVSISVVPGIRNFNQTLNKLAHCFVVGTIYGIGFVCFGLMLSGMTIVVCSFLEAMVGWDCFELVADFLEKFI